VTVAMLILPLAVAVVLALAPLERRAAEGLALAGALAEVALGAVALVRFDTGGGLQFVTDRVWISDLYANVDVRFHVGMDGLSLFMVLLVSVGVAAAVASAMRAQRQKPRAYLSLLLLLECALVLLFTAQNLALFYVGWEAMMIPLYVLMATWGGEGRRRATLTFFIYTLVGSLLMLVAIAAIGIDQGTFERSALIGRAHMPTWQFFCLAAAFCIKAPLFPLHGWMPAAYRQSTSEVSALLSGVISKAGAYGLLAFAIPLFDSSARDWRWLFLGLALVGLLYGSLVAFRQPDARGVIAYSSLGQMNLIVIGIFAFNTNGSAGATFQMVNHGIVSLAAFLLIGLIELRTHTDAFKYLGGLANGRPVLSTIFLITALMALAVPGSSVFVSELYVLIGAFQQAAWLGVLASFTIVLAAMYMLRWYSALVHEGDGERVRPDLPELKPFELGVAVPLVLILLAMSFYPFGVMQRLQTALPTTPIPTLYEASR
jgi:NADH-quinone oxidoreductase subunit M